jgi:hypothetical protein
VLGVFQNILNATTSKLLYQFDVKGSLKNPTVTAIPTPILTEQVARIFGVMIHKERDAHLLEELKK